MPEALAPTLVELRNSVLVRGGYSVSGGQAADAYPLVDELLRKAQRELHLEAPWLTQRTRATYSLITDQAVYDTPDDALMSRLGRIAVINDSGNEFDLTAYHGAQLRNITKTSGMPYAYEIVDRALRLYPAPTATWVTLVIEYYQNPASLLSETDRTNVDPEALIQRAAYLLKRHTGLGGDYKADMADHMRYLQRTSQEQGEIRAISMRGYVPVVYDNLRLRGSRYWRTDWNPWVVLLCAMLTGLKAS
jgi:hypothetical protein